MKTILAVLFAPLLVASAQAAPILSLDCGKVATGNYANVEIDTDLFAPAAPERILSWAVTLAKNPTNGDPASKKDYEDQSNMKIFNDDAGASAWVKTNTVIIPLYDNSHMDDVILVNAAQNQITVIDTDGETSQTLSCTKRK
jgi:hypothetical protein